MILKHDSINEGNFTNGIKILVQSESETPKLTYIIHWDADRYTNSETPKKKHHTRGHNAQATHPLRMQ